VALFCSVQLADHRPLGRSLKTSFFTHRHHEAYGPMLPDTDP
jgi:hypothetical protein